MKFAEKRKRSLPRKILNAIIAAFGVLVVFVLIAIGYMQTSTFREWLREKIISEANSALNGELKIENIEGTILTSLYISGISLSTETDTILSAQSIGLKTRPLDIFFGKIYLSEVIIDQLDLKLQQDSTLNWNTAALFASSETDTPSVEETDIKNEDSSYPFTLIINDLKFTNLSLSKKKYEYLGKNVLYESMETNDLQIKNLNLDAKLAVDLDDIQVRLLINKLAFNPNFKNFELQDFNGAFFVTKEFAEVNNLQFKTDDAHFQITTRMDSINLFSSLDIEDFENYPMKLDFKVTNFEFDDLSSFLDAITILNGSADVELEAEGKFGDFTIHKLIVDYGNTHFELDGRIKNLNTPSHFIIDANFYNSFADFNDAINLLHKIDLPQFTTLKIDKFEGKFLGEPTNFHTVGNAVIDGGKIKFDTRLNLQPDVMEYDTKFETKNLNVNSVVPFTSKLNSRGSVVGRGTSPEDLDSQFEIEINNSQIDGHQFESFYFYSIAEEHIFDIILDAKINGATTSFDGELDFRLASNPFYNLNGYVKNLDISRFTNDSTLVSDLNFQFDAKGRDLDIDAMMGEFSVMIDSSHLRNKFLYGNSFELKLDKEFKRRFVNFQSDFLDLNLTGDFRITDALELLEYETETIIDLIEQKYSSFNPILDVSDSVIVEEALPKVLDKNIEIDYHFDFKDFSIIQIIAGSDKMDIDGSGHGKIINDSTNFSIAAEVDFSHFITAKGKDAIYFNDVNSDFHFSRNNRIKSFENLFGSLSITGERLFAGTDFNELNVDLIFNQSKLYYNIYFLLNNYLETSAEGSVEMNPNEQQFNFDSFAIGHNDVWWENRDTLSIMFDSTSMSLKNFDLILDEAELMIDGFIQADGSQNINIVLNDLSGESLFKFLSNSPESNFNSITDMIVSINGSLREPQIFVELETDKISFKDVSLGYLKSSFEYSDKEVKTDIKLTRAKIDSIGELLDISGTIPINLGFIDVEERIPFDSEIDLHLRSSEFNLNSLGDIIPQISSQSGIIDSDIRFAGTIEYPTYEGYLKLNNGFFRLDANNLYYKTNLNLLLNEESIECESITLENAGGSNFNGILRGNGNIDFDGLKLDEVKLKVFGDIAVMSYLTRSVNSELYGNLFIGSDGIWNLGYKENTISFTGDILLKETDLVFTLKESQVVQSQKGFNYQIIEEKVEVDSARAIFLELVKEIRSKDKAEDDDDNLLNLNYNYSINLTTEKEAQVVMNLYKALGQKIIVYSTGSMFLQNEGENKRAQGSFQLLDGSRMEFIKTFDAVGDIKFESDLTDPYLDIVASYYGSYVPPGNQEDARAEDVAIKVRVQGPLSSLSENFALTKNNISVYKGRNNIENNIPDSRYDDSDAISFIIVGKFRDELTSTDNNAMANNLGAAVAFLSPVISSYLTSATGNLVDDVQISQAGSYTRIGITGKYKDLRYKFGGTTADLTNLSRANVLVQYFINRNISLRYERKNPIIYYESSTTDKINELGLRYKFEF